MFNYRSCLQANKEKVKRKKGKNEKNKKKSGSWWFVVRRNLIHQIRTIGAGYSLSVLL